jgi:hypothetical protein
MTERPVFSECVIGYRSWKLDDWVLSPVVYGSPWRPGVNRAQCKAHPDWWLDPDDTERAPHGHSAPHEHCRCGLHAYHDLPERTQGSVIGAVAAWGDLQVHHNGFRAECAQIVALVAGECLEEVAATYGVPLVARELLAAEAQQHGSPLPVALRPEAPRTQAAGATSVTFMNALRQAWTQPQFYPMTPIQWSWSPSAGLTSSSLWTPADEAQATPAQKLSKYGKKPSNRQGPPRPQRAPRELGRGS